MSSPKINGEHEKEKDLDLAVIGNCAYSALIDRNGQIVWSCFPRLDGDPIFCSLVKRTTLATSDVGFFDLKLDLFAKSKQHYLKNSAVLSTTLEDERGASLEIIDFIPRFEFQEREFRPYMLIRMITPRKGVPRVQFRLRPTFGYGWGTPEKTRGSNHIRFILSNTTIRLTTNAPISFVADEVFFEVYEPIYMVLMPDESLKTSLHETCSTFLDKTLEYWRNWVKSLDIPFEWQEQVIRASITLKLSNFEETGAFVASMTTSIPTTTARLSNYDGRYCWLTNAYLYVPVLTRLKRNTLEQYLLFLSNVVADFDSNKKIQSVYGISLEKRLHQREMHRLPGYRGMGPIVIGTEDIEREQHAIYGSLILALTPLFFDLRFHHPGDKILFQRMENLGHEALRLFDKKDYSIIKGSEMNLHTYTTALSWAGFDRLARIATKCGEKEKAAFWQGKADSTKEIIFQRCWNEKKNSFVSTWDGDQVDPTLLLLPEIGIVKAKDDYFKKTLECIEKELKCQDFIKECPSDNVVSTRATFWFIMAMQQSGKKQEAKALFKKMLAIQNHSGFYSETFDPVTKEHWGNTPHNSTLVSFLQCAHRLSKSWDWIVSF